MEGCHQQVVITSDICSWKASCPGNVHSCVKAPFHQDVVDLIVMFSIWAVPGPSSRCFVWAKCVSQHQLIVHCKFEEPVTSLICFRVAERSASVLPVVLRNELITMSSGHLANSTNKKVNCYQFIQCNSN